MCLGELQRVRAVYPAHFSEFDADRSREKGYRSEVTGVWASAAQQPCASGYSAYWESLDSSGYAYLHFRTPAAAIELAAWLLRYVAHDAGDDDSQEGERRGRVDWRLVAQNDPETTDDDGELEGNA